MTSFPNRIRQTQHHPTGDGHPIALWHTIFDFFLDFCKRNFDKLDASHIRRKLLLSKNGTEQMKNQDVTGTVYRLKLAGTYLLTDDFYIGFVHPSERYQEPRLGEVVKGRVEPFHKPCRDLKATSHQLLL